MIVVYIAQRMVSHESFTHVELDRRREWVGEVGAAGAIVKRRGEELARGGDSDMPLLVAGSLIAPNDLDADGSAYELGRRTCC